MYLDGLFIMLPNVIKSGYYFQAPILQLLNNCFHNIIQYD